MRRFKLIRGMSALFVLFFAFLTMGARITAQASDFSLTIVKLSQTTEEHAINIPPTTQLEPVAGGTYQLWVIDDFDNETDDYQATLSALNKLTLTELSQRYSAEQVSEPTNASGETTLTGLSQTSFYVREITQGASSLSLPFLLVLPLVDDAGNILPETTVYPKTQLQTGGLSLTKYGLSTPTSSRDEAVLLEGIEFQLFAASDDDELYPLGFDEGGQYDATLAGTILVTDASGRIEVGGLVAGPYFFKEVKTQSPYELNEERLLVEVAAGAVAEVTMDNYEIDHGGYRFKKIAGDKNKQALAGAEFKVTQLVAGKYENILDEAGKEIVLRSGSDGLFEVRDLPLGDYYLVETKAPIVGNTTYELLKTPIKFTITSTSYDTEIMEIINLPKAPPIIPGTGDWRLYALMAIIIVAFLIGLQLYVKGSDRKE